MIIIMGDIHGQFKLVNHVIETLPLDSIILQVGDFGWWPRFHNKIRLSSDGRQIAWDQYSLNTKGIKLFWCDGNHEDFEHLETIKTNEVMKNVFYMKRGSILQLPDGRKVLFMGGGNSIDMRYRIQGLTWFPQENISHKDIRNLPDEKIDIIISHTAPLEFNIGRRYEDDPNRRVLSHLLERYQPRLWYFGHFHFYQRGIYKNCRWTALADTYSDEKWYEKLAEDRGIDTLI
jgi:Icc-related predicted phosphoesterase